MIISGVGVRRGEEWKTKENESMEDCGVLIRN